MGRGTFVVLVGALLVALAILLWLRRRQATGLAGPWVQRSMDPTVAVPAAPRPPCPASAPRTRVDVSEIAAGVFLGLWYFVLSVAFLAAAGGALAVWASGWHPGR